MKNTLLKTAAILAVTLGTSICAQAQTQAQDQVQAQDPQGVTPPEEIKAKDGTQLWDLFHGAPKITDENGNYLKVRGRLLWDVSDISEDFTGGASNDVDGEFFRQARIGFEGQYGDLQFKSEIDFAEGDVTVTDLYLTWKSAFNSDIDVSFGQFKTTNSLHELESGRFLSFLERATVTDALGFDRRVGLKVETHKDRYGVQAGVFGNSINGDQDGDPTTTVGSARAYITPVKAERRVLHFGAHSRYVADVSGAPSRSQRPGSRLTNQRIRAEVGGDAWLFGGEFAGVYGPFYAMAEYITENGNNGTADGGFINVGWYLTGETRNYKKGTFDRVKPANPVSKGGFGLFEVAAGYDTFDSLELPRGEQIDAFTVGLNWFPESHLKLGVSYVDTNAELFDSQALNVRFQVDW